MRLLSIFIFSTFLFFSCKNKATPTSEATPGTTTTQPPAMLPGAEGVTTSKEVLDPETGEKKIVAKPINALSTTIGPAPKRIVDPIVPKQYKPLPRTPQQQKVHDALMKNYWVVNTLLRIKDKPANVQNQGAWFKFHPNGVYDYGFFNEKHASGAWTFDGQNALLFLDSELLGDDREWSIKIGKGEEIMIWLGTERFATTDTQLRLKNFIQKPRNREEMGLKPLKEEPKDTIE